MCKTLNVVGSVLWKTAPNSIHLFDTFCQILFIQRSPLPRISPENVLPQILHFLWFLLFSFWLEKQDWQFFLLPVLQFLFLIYFFFILIVFILCFCLFHLFKFFSFLYWIVCSSVCREFNDPKLFHYFFSYWQIQIRQKIKSTFFCFS